MNRSMVAKVNSGCVLLALSGCAAASSPSLSSEAGVATDSEQPNAIDAGFADTAYSVDTSPPPVDANVNSCPAASPSDYGHPLCYSCVSRECCGPITAARDFPGAVPFYRCVQACRADVPCLQGCYAMHPGVVEVLMASSNCQDRLCADDCAPRARVAVYNLARQSARFCGRCANGAVVASDTIAPGAATQMRFEVPQGPTCDIWFVPDGDVCLEPNGSLTAIATTMVRSQLPLLALTENAGAPRLVAVPPVDRSQAVASDIWLWNGTGSPLRIDDVVSGSGVERIAATLTAETGAVWSGANTRAGLYSPSGQFFVVQQNLRTSLELTAGLNCMLYLHPDQPGFSCAYR